MPAVGRDNPGGEEAADKAAERKSRPEQSDNNGAQPARGIFRRKADEAWHGTAEPEPGEKAEREQDGEARRQRRANSENAEARGRADQHGFAADPIRQDAETESAQSEAGQRGTENRAQPGRRNVQIGGDAGRGKPDGLQIEAIEQGDERAPDDDTNLQRAERARVDQFGNIKCRLRGHDGHPSPDFVPTIKQSSWLTSAVSGALTPGPRLLPFRTDRRPIAAG